MIFFLLAWSLLAACGFLVGNSILTSLDGHERAFDRAGDRLVVCIWLGMVSISAALLGLSLFSPLSPPVVLPLTGGLAALSLCFSKTREEIRKLYSAFSWKQAPGLLAIVLGVAAYSCQVVFWYDTGLYHFQMIKWLSEFGSVPGLALIHSRFGYPSSWYTLAAPFNQGALSGRVAALTGGFSALAGVSHFSLVLLRAANRRARQEDWFVLFAYLLILPLMLLWGITLSSSPDVPVIILCPIVGWVILTVSKTGKENDSKPTGTMTIRLLPLILSAGVVTIKLNGFPLLAVSLFYYFSGDRQITPKKAAAAVVVIVLLMVPLVAAGIISSGLPFYPSPLFPLDLPWSLGAERAIAESRTILQWARWGGPTPPDATSLGWIVPWFLSETIGAVLFLISMASTVPCWRRRSNNRGFGSGYVMAIALLGIGFMFNSAPTLRLGLGYLALLPALLASFDSSFYNRLFDRFAKTRKLINFSTIGVVLLIFLAGRTYIFPASFPKIIGKALQEKRIARAENDRSRFAVPPRLLNYSQVFDNARRKVLEIRGLGAVTGWCEDFEYFRPQDGDQCWDLPLPCSPGVLKGVGLRDKEGIKWGFVNK